ncbi:hypothetical protein AMELA_G00071230 [Ameiurus melas]|uniref:Protein kinase domain-containing protein n=1 Tax=Ameiurus melas TaxID=219545 RepID=A0A7J6B1A9_AMEME|nr:hypothetical protein AMELA_G00071230 [Ameiurus melas]
MGEERRVPIKTPWSSRSEVSCCSDLYTSVGGSPELSSQAESVYINAESIQCCDTSCSSVSQNWGFFCLCTEVEKTSGVAQEAGSEPEKLGSSVEALFGSDSSRDGESFGSDCDSDSSCVNADWERSFDSDTDSCNLVYSFTEAQWGSASSRSCSAASGYITDYALESSLSTTEQHGLSVFDGHFEGGYHDLPVSQFKPGHCDSPAKNLEYREGQDYSVLRHVQNGSYGDVFSVRDKRTGFTCAAKRIPLSSFSWQEVGTWSRLDSPRVLQLYGVVREGLNVVLFMDLKTGSLAQFLKARGRFAEEVALYYHCQVLQALEHLHSRKVIHLDVKVDNVLLSKDKTECFLCDFGLSEMLDRTGYSTKTFRGKTGVW